MAQFPTEILRKLPGGEGVLFTVSRSIDDDLVVYKAVRHGNSLIEPFVDTYWTKKKNLKSQESMSDKAKRMFFMPTVKLFPEGYRLVVKALPDRVLTLHLKKSGKVLAKGIISGKQARIENVHVEVSTEASLLPKVEYVLITGTHKHEQISEKVPVSASFQEQYDVSSFLPQFMFG